MWVGCFSHQNWYKVEHCLVGKMRQMRHYIRGIETVPHFAYFNDFVGFFCKNDEKSTVSLFRSVLTPKVTNSYQPGRPTTVAAFLVLYGKYEVNNSDTDTHKSRTGKDGDRGKDSLLPLRS